MNLNAETFGVSEVIMIIIFALASILIPLAPVIFMKIGRMKEWHDGMECDVSVSGFSVSEDGGKLTLNVSSNPKNIGISEFYPEYEECGVFVEFGTTYKTGEAKSAVTIDLPSECDSVYFHRGGSKYQLVLEKNESGQWTDSGWKYAYRERNYK